MSDIIKHFYENAGTMPVLFQRKLARFNNNPDIQEKSEYWIKNKKFRSSGGVTKQGYNAEKLASLSECLDGEGAFDLLLELRDSVENPNGRWRCFTAEEVERAVKWIDLEEKDERTVQEVPDDIQAEVDGIAAAVGKLRELLGGVEV